MRGVTLPALVVALTTACGGPGPGPGSPSAPPPGSVAPAPSSAPSTVVPAPQPPGEREPNVKQRAARVVGLLEGGAELEELPIESGWLGSGRRRQPWVQSHLTVHGTLDQRTRTLTVTRRLIKLCVMRSLDEGSTPGELRLQVLFRPDGRALPVKLSGSPEPALASCLTAQLGRLRSQAFSGPSPVIRGRVSYGIQ